MKKIKRHDHARGHILTRMGKTSTGQLPLPLTTPAKKNSSDHFSPGDAHKKTISQMLGLPREESPYGYGALTADERQFLNHKWSNAASFDEFE